MGSDLASLILKDAGIFLAIFGTVFLFWRSCRFELFTSEQIFDTLLVAVLGGLFIGRLFGFLISFQEYGLSLYKFLFFHIYPAFNFWGFVLGCLVSTAVFFRNKKVSLFSFFDLAAGPILFGLFVYFLFSSAFVYSKTGRVDLAALFFILIYFLLFFVLQRLASLKRHKGFFSCYFLVFAPFLNLIHFLIFNLSKVNNAKVLYENTLVLGVLLFGLALWHRLDRRSFKKDIKQVAGFIFLRTVGFFRTIRSANEAGKVSRSFILAPYTILKGILVLLRSVSKEIWLGFEQFLYTLGIKHLK